MITGSVRVDLTAVPADRRRHRVGALDIAPCGARVVVIVGALFAEPAIIRELRGHTHRLHVDLQGEPITVGRWMAALRTGETFPGLTV